MCPVIGAGRTSRGAVNPVHAVRFFLEHRGHGFLLLGSVVLCITGGEALYADMGHFGRKPIRWAWYGVVFPALLCNYFGQGAALIERGEAVQAVQLGYCPRVTIVHTSGTAEGQIYIPEVNRILMVACIALVVGRTRHADRAVGRDATDLGRPGG